ncbi:MAG: C4-type zinc ribbon domain-containing protein [Mycobacterium sp.]|nr:C4-type zinc ribbon domain-containing protein [Mycobacterium sp.]
MKAEVSQQRLLLELAELDAAMNRLTHRSTHLVEQQRFDAVQAEHREANDRLAALSLAVEDLDAQVTKFESEIDAVRQRETRDQKLMDSGSVGAKQVAELQHELETLQRRQASLEEQQLEIMERREVLQGEQAEELALMDALQGDLTTAQVDRDNALVAIDESRQVAADRRVALLGSMAPELAEMYERQRKQGGAGAGLLQGARCGACRIEIDRGELSRISAAAEDDVVRCPECGVILVRVKDFRAGESSL